MSAVFTPGNFHHKVNLLTTIIATSSQFQALEKYVVKPRPMSLRINSSTNTTAKKIFKTLNTSFNIGLLSKYTSSKAYERNVYQQLLKNFGT